MLFFLKTKRTPPRSKTHAETLVSYRWADSHAQSNLHSHQKRPREERDKRGKPAERGVPVRMRCETITPLPRLQMPKKNSPAFVFERGEDTGESKL